MMKKILRRQGLLILLFLLMGGAFVGCNVMDDQQREDRLKELLKEKYGEEFEVREMYVKESVEAWCYPVNNPDVIFMIATSLKMDEISKDYYLQQQVCMQIEEELQPQIEMIFPKCFVSTSISVANTNNFEDYSNKGVNAEQLITYFRSENLSDSISISVFVDCDNITDENIDTEIIQLIDMVNTESDKMNNPYIHFYLYPCNYDKIKDIKEIVQTWNWHSIANNNIEDIYDYLEDFKRISLLFDQDENVYIIDNNGNKVSFEESIYVEQRKKFCK